MIRRARLACLLFLAWSSGALTVALWPSERRGLPEGGSLPPGVRLASTGAWAESYRQGRRDLRVAAETFAADVWGCGWLTGVEMYTQTRQSAQAGGFASSLRVSARAGLIGPEQTAAVFAHGVEIRHVDGRTARGDALLATEGLYELRGSPAVANTDRGEIYAPSLTYREESGGTSGSGGVSAYLDGVDVPGDGGAQTWIASESFESIGETMVFRGDAVAWSGSDMLTAAELSVGDDWLSACGEVRMERGRRYVVTADSVERHGDLLDFRGNVRAVDVDGQALECSALVVELDADEQPVTAECRNAWLLDAWGDFEIEAARVARYDFASGIATAQDAVIRIGQRTMRAPSIRYDRASGYFRAGLD